MRLGVLASALVPTLLLAGAALATDRDGDGVDDAADNCSILANPDQRDTDADGFGNRCDADLDGDGLVDQPDLWIFVSRFGSADPDADFDGNGIVDLADLDLVSRSLSLPPGPGALSDPGPGHGVVCDAGPWARCTVHVVPGIELDVAESQLVPAGAGFRILGQVGIPTPVGQILLPTTDLTVVPGTSLEGVTGSPDFGVGFLFGDAGDLYDGGGASVRVTIARGDAIEADVPLNADVTYLSFDYSSSSGGAALGPLRVSGSGGNGRLLIDPVDPFFYLAGEVSLVRSTGGGSSGAGSGFEALEGLLEAVGGRSTLGVGLSLTGRVPFVPRTTTAIRERLPEIEGHLVMYVNGAIPRLPVSVEALSVTDLDPRGDGLALFGDDPVRGSDVITGFHGDFGIELGLRGIDFEIAAIGASGLYSAGSELAGDPDRFALAGQMEPFSDWGPLAAALLQIPPNLPPLGFGLMVSSDPSETFFAVAFEDLVTVDTKTLGHGLGLELDVLTTSRAELLFDAFGMQLGAESFGESIHEDVHFEERHEMRLIAPWEGDTEVILRGTSQIADVRLFESEMRLTATSLRHTGRVVTPRTSFELTGVISHEGPLLEGTYTFPVTYRYPEVDAVLEVAGIVAEHEATIAALEAARAVELSELAAAEAELAGFRRDVQNASNVVAGWAAELAAARNALYAHDAINCWNFQWWEFWRWAVEGPACEAWKAAVRPVLQAALLVAETTLQLARAALLALTAPAQAAELAYSAAQDAVAILDASVDEARAALLAARDHRASLPQQDIEIDATVSLRLTNQGLTGTVSGSFQGVAFGGGSIESGAGGILACLVVPQTGEEMCAPL